jgi:3-methyladenine DNA glycosylase AlkD
VVHQKNRAREAAIERKHSLDHGTSDAALLASDITVRLRALGAVKTEPIRAVRRQFSKRLAKADASVVVQVALRLLEQPGIASRFVAYELICHHRGALGSLRANELRQLGRGIDSWGAVDCFACFLAGPAWREKQVPDTLIHRWAASSDRWWRRAALVSTVPLNNKTRGGKGDSARTLQVCRLLASDRDDMVVKALSWALREAAKRDPESVRRFLIKYKSTLAPRVLREVKNKLRTGLKNPRKRPGPRRTVDNR